MRLYVKNMVCNRCIAAVKTLLEGLQVAPVSVRLGEVELAEDLSAERLKALKNGLADLGFELLTDEKSTLIEKIKTAIIEQVHHGAGDNRYNLSHVLSSKLNKDYSYLSHLFSGVEGITIEKYLILQKIEKAKELLAYGEQTLGDIAADLGYSSVAHLSAQFKKTTGLTPSHFKKLGNTQRRPLDEV